MVIWYIVVDCQTGLWYLFDLIAFEKERYSVNLPFKEYHPILPNIYGLSLRQLKSLNCRLSNDRTSLCQYDHVFQDQLKEGNTEDVKLDDEVESVTYHKKKWLRLKVLRPK